MRNRDYIRYNDCLYDYHYYKRKLVSVRVNEVFYSRILNNYPGGFSEFVNDSIKKYVEENFNKLFPERIK